MSRVGVPLGGECPPGTQNSFMNYELSLLPGHSKILLLGNQQAIKAVTVLVKMFDPIKGKLSHYYTLRAGKSTSRIQAIFGNLS